MFFMRINHLVVVASSVLPPWTTLPPLSTGGFILSVVSLMVGVALRWFGWRGLAVALATCVVGAGLLRRGPLIWAGGRWCSWGVPLVPPALACLLLALWALVALVVPALSSWGPFGALAVLVFAACPIFPLVCPCSHAGWVFGTLGAGRTSGTCILGASLAPRGG